MKRLYPIALVAVVALVLAASGAFSQGMMRGQQQQAMGDVPGLTQNPLTAEQRQQVTQIRQQTASQINSVRTDPNLTPTQRNQRITQLQQQQHSQIMNILTPAQRQEFSNWWRDRQAMRPGVGAGPGVVRSRMGDVPGLRQNPLTEQQRQQVTQIRQQTASQIASVRADQSLTPSQRNQRMAELQAQQHAQIMNVLTPAQRQEFSDWWRDTHAMRPGVGAGPEMRPDTPMKGDIPGLTQNPLSEQQRQQIAQIRTETHQQVRQIMDDPNLTAQQKQERISTVKMQGHDRIVGVMTPAQREEFMEWARTHPGADQRLVDG